VKNHFARIGRTEDADDPLPSNLPSDLPSDAAASDAEMPEPDAFEKTVVAADLGAAREILGDEERDRHYRRVHLQYRAMAEALDVLDAPDAIDSYSWRERLVEFVPRETTDPDG